MRPSTLSSSALLLLLAACNFQVFDTFAEDTPTTAFVDRSYGARVALTGDANGITVLAAGGKPGEGVRFFSVGDGKSAPSTVPRSTAALCELSTDKIVAGTPCVGGTTLAAAGTLNDGGSDATPGLDHIGCFAVGYGRVTTAATLYGPVIACADGQVFTLGGATGSQVEKGLSLLDPAALSALRIAFAALPGAGKLPSKNPPLLMGSEADGGAWFWPAATPGSAPRVVPAPSDGKATRFGATVAMARAAGTSLLLVAAPEAGRIYAYTPGATAADPPVPAACLEGEKGAGTAIGVGDLDGDGLDDLAVTDPRRVRIFLGKNRPTTLGAGDCPSTWPAEGLAITCAEAGGASGCATAQFGASLAIGDLDGNGQVDLAVGAPGAGYSGVEGAGAVFLFSPLASTTVLDVRGLASPSAGDAFGAAVTIGKVGTQDTLAVGASGKAGTYVTWCTKLPGNPGGARCRR